MATLAGQEQALGVQLIRLEQAQQARAAAYRNQLRTLQEQYSER